MKNYKNIFAVLFLILFSIQLSAEGDEKNKQDKLFKINGEPNFTYFNINNISTIIYNDGDSDNSFTGNSGFEYPKGSKKTSFYQTGLIWGGIVNGQKRVGGSDYRSGLIPGKIRNNGEADDPNLSSVRIYRVRPDYKTSNLESDFEIIPEYEIIDGRNTLVNQILITDLIELRKNYEKDWNEWPASDGAPFEDIDGDGIYNPEIDIPGVPGADQTIWFVANDLNEIQTKQYHGSPPIGIEMQATFWGYKSNGALGNTMFRKYTVINKSESIIDSMYFSMWSDSDLGDATDDLIGCDTLLNMIYSYNGDNHDATYGLSIPACGIVLLQGPISDGSPFDEAIFRGRKIKGKKNLHMSSFNYVYKCCSPDYGSPEYDDYNGTIGMYNYLQGLTRVGNPFPVPEIFGGGYTKFPFSGDPITGEGFIGGIASFPQDHRMGLGTGPFTMAVGDTQEVIYAQLVAGGTLKIQRLDAIKFLRYYSNAAKELYYENFNFPRISDQPIPSISILNEEAAGNIILSWDNEFNKENIEKIESNGFKFQGYNLYQTHFSNSFMPDEKKEKIITYDLIDGIKNIEGFVPNPESGFAEDGIIQYASDSGIQREFIIEKDYFTNLPLAKGNKYFFSLTAYYYNASENKIFETPKTTIDFIFKEFYDGPTYKDTIFVKGNTKSSSGFIICNIIVPELLTGDNYKIEFEKFNNKLYWNLFNLTDNSYAVKNQEIIPYSDFRFYNYNLSPPIIDGLQIHVVSPDPDAVKEGGMVEVSYGGGVLPPNAWDDLGSKFSGNSVLNDINWDNGGTRDIYSIDYDLNWKGYYEILNKNYRDFEIRFTNNENFGFGYYRRDSVYVVKVPFEIWDIGVNTPDDRSDDKRLIPSVPIFRKKDTTLTINSEYSGSSSSYRCSNLINFYDIEVSDGYFRFEQEAKRVGGGGALYPYKNDGSESGVWIKIPNKKSIFSAFLIDRFRFCDLNNDGQWPEAGTVIRILTEKPYQHGESYFFKVPDNTIILKKHVLFQNYPNPFNPNTTIKFFMPEKANISIDIFNILGEKVQNIIKEELSAGVHEKSFNAENLASGVYIYRLQVENKFIETKKMLFIK